MTENGASSKGSSPAISFFDRPKVERMLFPIQQGIPIGFESVYSPQLGIGGTYGTWGQGYDNEALPRFVEQRLGEPMKREEILNLAELGFVSRHHIPLLSGPEHLELEIEVGARLLREAARTCGWDPSEVQGVLIGMSGPITHDYVAQIARRAGIPDHALKVSVHKACDGSMGALHLALDPRMAGAGQTNIAEELRGKKVLVGGIEGLSRLLSDSRDKNALQLFGNGAGVIGIVPGKTMKFLAGKSQEVFDEEGLLEVRMFYPHSSVRVPGESLVEVTQDGPAHIRVAGLMHEPEDGTSVVMAGLMGMVKLFVRTGVQVVSEVVRDYQTLMSKVGTPDKSFAVAIVHHANYKINLLKEKHLQKLGIRFPMPWLLSEFGNVSAASNIIAFLRQLPSLKPGDHVLFDGFGAGTYYDVLAVAMGA
ncbi:MAG: 3-oxoacyl-[acyl-carrier-protein] synthase III C-terminal domain-containing protein [Anaerolineales bacterium]|jgi:3-oxoacyl-[acyl-carrier-protein] synthase III